MGQGGGLPVVARARAGPERPQGGDAGRAQATRSRQAGAGAISPHARHRLHGAVQGAGLRRVRQGEERGGEEERRVRAGRRRRQSRARHGNRRHERGSRWRSKPGHRRLEQKNQSPGSDLRRQGQRRGSHKAAFRHETRAHTTRVREGRGGGPAQAAGGGGRGGTTPRGTEGHPRRTGRRRWVPARRGVAGAGETRGWPERRRGWIRYRGRIRQRCIVGWGGCG